MKFIHLAFSSVHFDGSCELQVEPGTSLLLEAIKLSRSGRMHASDLVQLEPGASWFQQHMTGEEFVSAAYREEARYWFKLLPLTHIRHMATLRALLEQYGYKFDLHLTENPGVRVYEDNWAVVAIPEVSYTETSGHSVRENVKALCEYTSPSEVQAMREQNVRLLRSYRKDRQVEL